MSPSEDIRKRITLLGEQWQAKGNDWQARFQPQRSRQFVQQTINRLLTSDPEEVESELLESPPIPSNPWSEFSNTIEQKYSSPSASNLAPVTIPDLQIGELEDTPSSVENNIWPNPVPSISTPESPVLLRPSASQPISSSALSSTPILTASEPVASRSTSQQPLAPIQPQRDLAVSSPLSSPSSPLTPLMQQSETSRTPYSRPRIGRHADPRHSPPDDTPLSLPKSTTTKTLPTEHLSKPQAQVQKLADRVESSSYSVINHRLQGFLSQFLKTQQVPNVKIYSNAAAQALTKIYQADAMTYENKILLGNGSYNPDSPETIALLGHELTHIHAANGSPFTNPAAEIQEEQTALQNETRLRQFLHKVPPESIPSTLSSSPGSAAMPPSPPPISSGATGTTGFQFGPPPSRAMVTPKLAESKRDLEHSEPDQSEEGASKQNIERPLSMMHLEQVKCYIMNELRTDAERLGLR